MSDVQKCLSVFAVAAVTNNVRSISLASAAIDDYLTPHVPTGTAESALRTLLRAFRNMRVESVVADAIRDDLEDRLERLREPTLLAAANTGPQTRGFTPSGVDL